MRQRGTGNTVPRFCVNKVAALLPKKYSIMQSER